MTGSRRRPLRGLFTRGAGLVLAMVLLGGTATGGLFWFWDTRTAEFLPLADALAARLPGSSPRVEGGRRRRPDPDETVLQVMLKVPFDPAAAGADAEPTLAAVRGTVAASDYAGRYDVLEVHLRHDGPGGVITSSTVREPLAGDE